MNRGRRGGRYYRNGEVRANCFNCGYYGHLARHCPYLSRVAQMQPRPGRPMPASQPQSFWGYPPTPEITRFYTEMFNQQSQGQWPQANQQLTTFPQIQAPQPPQQNVMIGIIEEPKMSASADEELEDMQVEQLDTTTEMDISEEQSSEEMLENHELKNEWHGVTSAKSEMIGAENLRLESRSVSIPLESSSQVRSMSGMESPSLSHVLDILFCMRSIMNEVSHWITTSTACLIPDLMCRQ